MPTAQEIMEQAKTMLLEGKVQEAHDLLADKVANPDPPPPIPVAIEKAVVARTIPSWVTDATLVSGLLGELLPLLEAFVMHQGSPPTHVELLAPLKSLHASLSK